MNAIHSFRNQPAVREWRPWFISDWVEVVFMHFEVPTNELQQHVPFPLDLHEGRAFVSLVSFGMDRLHPAGTGWFGRMAFRPWKHQWLLNLRTYVRQDGEPGIYFLSEWINDRLNAAVGPWLYGLPYRWAENRCTHCFEKRQWCGAVRDRRTGGRFAYHAKAPLAACPGHATLDSLDQFLLERYAAITVQKNRQRLFRIDHAQWPQIPVVIQLTDQSLLRQHASWWDRAIPTGGHASPGVTGIQMGPPCLLHTA